MLGMGCRKVAKISGGGFMILPVPSFYEGPSTVNRLHPVLSGSLRLACQSLPDKDSVQPHHILRTADPQRC